MNRFAVILATVVGVGCTDMQNPPSDAEISASIDAFNNRRIYATLDPPTLRQIPDADVEQAVIDFVVTKLEGNYEQEVLVVRELSPGVRALYITWMVEAEVSNGGFNQFYYNSSGEFAPDAPAAFEYFGATQHAALMREANAVRAEEAAEVAKFKDEGTIEAFSESYKHTKLNPLDDRFYALEENLSALRVARIRAMPEEFSGR